MLPVAGMIGVWNFYLKQKSAHWKLMSCEERCATCLKINQIPVPMPFGSYAIFRQA
jgi:hypothetical protein